MHGYVVDITSGSHGYYCAEDDRGALWQWEPEVYVNVVSTLAIGTSSRSAPRSRETLPALR